MEIPGGGGSNVKPFEMENLAEWGVKLEKTLRGGGGGGGRGYGYFLEPRNLTKSYFGKYHALYPV